MLAARLARCAHAFRIGASIHAPKLQFAGTIVKMGLVTSFVAVCNATSKCMDTTQVDEVDIVMRELLGAASAARADAEVQQGAVSGGPPSDSESSSEDEDEDDFDDSPGGDEPFTTPVWGLRPGPAKHDLLGAGTIIAIHDSEQTLSGITVAFSAQNAGKVPRSWISGMYVRPRFPESVNGWLARSRRGRIMSALA